MAAMGLQGRGGRTEDRGDLDAWLGQTPPPARQLTSPASYRGEKARFCRHFHALIYNDEARFENRGKGRWGPIMSSISPVWPFHTGLSVPGGHPGIHHGHPVAQHCVKRITGLPCEYLRNPGQSPGACRAHEQSLLRPPVLPAPVIPWIQNGSFGSSP